MPSVYHYIVGGYFSVVSKTYCSELYGNFVCVLVDKMRILKSLCDY